MLKAGVDKVYKDTIIGYGSKVMDAYFKIE